MDHSLSFLEVEVQIHFRPPHVRMRRHRVPRRSGCKLSESHDQLTASNAFQMDQPGDLARIHALGTTEFGALQLRTAYQSSWILRMGWIAQEIKFRWAICIGAGK